MSDLIERQAAIDALWKALYDYEDKTEKQFQKSEELDVADWIVHRIFVQNMSDIDRKVIHDLPSAELETKKGTWIDMGDFEQCSVCTASQPKTIRTVYGAVILMKSDYCPFCGADMREEE